MLIIPPPYPHCVYLVTNRAHVIIYVGVTSHLLARLGHHEAHKGWWPEVAGIQVEAFPTRPEADTRETALISLAQPIYNTIGTTEGSERFVDEMRQAVQSIQATRRALLSTAIQEPHAAVRVLDIQEERGVTLREASALLNRGLQGLRAAAQRKNFPAPVGRRGAGKTSEKLYDLDELRARYPVS